MTLKRDFGRLCRALAEACEAVYGERLVSVAVFGSVARGSMRPDSDLDVLIVAHDLPLGRLERMGEFAPVERRLEPLLAEARARGIHPDVSPLIRTPDEVRLGSSVYLDMTEAVDLRVDRDGFIAHFLERLRKRLARAGAQRVMRGGGHYWDLPVDFDLAEPPAT